MKRYDVAQGSPEWLRRRLGIPTASEFHRIISPTGKLSKQADGYMHRLLAEAMIGHPLEEIETKWMVHGVEMEAEAVRHYELMGNCETELIGFMTNDAGTVGASPDRGVGDKGLLQIKCPAPNTQLAYLLTGTVAEDYTPQLQGELYVAERDWTDIVSYHAELPRVVIRVNRNEEFLKPLAVALNEFVDRLMNHRAALEAKYGAFPNLWEQPAVDTFGGLGITDEDIAEIYADHFREPQ